MATVITGDRVGRQGRLGVGCSAAVFDVAHERILLVQRADNGRWAVPGGYMEPGEGLMEGCAREVYEETGLTVAATRLIGVYTDRHKLLVYPDGNRWQLIVLYFAAMRLGGDLTASDETTRCCFATPAEAAALDFGPLDRLRVADSFAFQASARIHNVI